MRIRIFDRTSDKNKKITKNFTVKELSCKCGICQKQYIDIDHINNLQKLRDKLGKPIIVTSGYRCEVWNNSVGGVANSQHRTGTATDIIIEGMTAAEVANECENFNGLGRYEDFTHIDSRSGDKARWGLSPKEDILPDGPSDEDINITLEEIENQILKN